MRYTKKDLLRKLGISRDTLRLYERRGLIAPEVDPKNGYRYYDDWQVNLLWDCRYYQGMGFSLSEIQRLLQQGGLDRMTGRMDEQLDKLKEDLRYRELMLDEHEVYRASLHRVREHLGVFEETVFDGCIYIVEREVHDLAEGTNSEAVSFANRHAAIMKPFFWFPNETVGHYLWGSAMRLPVYERLGEAVGPQGTVTFGQGRALSTYVDAGERGGFGLPIFEPLVREAAARNLCPRGGIYGTLLARTHEEDGFHRYVRAFLPVEG